MLFFKKLTKITGHILFVIILIFFSTSNVTSIEKFNNANNVSDYFSGILLLSQNKYDESYKYLKKLEGLERSHENYSLRYLYTLINSGNFKKAFNYSKKLEKQKMDSFESHLVIGINYLKHSKPDLAYEYFLKAKQRKTNSILDKFIINSLNIWSNLNQNSLEKSEFELGKLDKRFENLKKIQTVFLNCFFKTKHTQQLFDNLVLNEKIDFSRYNYFYANYLARVGNKQKAKEIIDVSLKKNPRNLLLNQYRIDLENSESKINFNCELKEHVIAELFYITANVMSSQSIYTVSNFYLNLSKFLNEDFHAFDTLIAENFYNIGDYSKAKKVYENLSYFGTAFKWYSQKQISRILINQNKKEESLSLIKKAYNDLPKKSIYQTFDFAEFLKNNEEFEDSITFYTKILRQINEQHPLFAEVTDSRGVAFERTGEWNKAEKDLLSSLKVSPDQAYVINYLAYSWIEKGLKIEQSLEMLKKANELKADDPYIIDSLGWALYKLKRYKESKDYLQIAVRLMPADPIVNDHYGDALWKNGNLIQARYYWKYVLSLEKTEQDLKEKIEKKLIKGL
tara:strand:+ start:964 stop:2664 length:1701 start_codon:yes stop_codon:yes gene_type:complete